jgi:hypothetical protein
MQEVQLVISILEHPELKKFRAGGRRAVAACLVKVGTEVVGELWRDARLEWRWVLDDHESEPYARRIEAALALVEQVYEEESPDRDVLEYESKGLRVVLHGSKFLCTGCGNWVPGSETGLRRIRRNLVRSQAQCSHCRGG